MFSKIELRQQISISSLDKKSRTRNDDNFQGHPAFGGSYL